MDRFPDRFVVAGLAAGSNWRLLAEQVKKYRPAVVSLAGEEDARKLLEELPDQHRPDIYWGEEGLVTVATCPGARVVLTAVTGTAGLLPTVKAIRAGKDIALANKETLVAGGGLVTRLALEHGIRILPVDSEHSAIWQCLGERAPVVSRRWSENTEGAVADEQRGLWRHSEVGSIILTASGGPFRLEPEDLAGVTVEMALAHPSWNMGKKITVDSATLMNKGLEVIEAHWLFGIDYGRIRVVVHPQSIIHSMVEFVDGSVLAQLGLPDMRLPIQYALGYPGRLSNDLPRLNWLELKQLTFEPPDHRRFPLLKMAFEAGKAGGTLPAVLNAANEVAVGAFLERKIGFLDIHRVVSRVMNGHRSVSSPSLEEILGADRAARREALRMIAGL